MGNSTAYPICTLLEKMPVIKTRALKEDEANQDDLLELASFSLVIFLRFGLNCGKHHPIDAFGRNPYPSPSCCAVANMMFWQTVLAGLSSTLIPS